MQEPTKAELLAYEADKSAVPARTAYCIVQAFPKSPVNEVEMELSGDSAKVRSWKQVHASTEHPVGKLELHAHFVPHAYMPYYPALRSKLSQVCIEQKCKHHMFGSMARPCHLKGL